MGKCQEDSYYDCISSQIDGSTEFFNEECSKKCIPNAFSNMGRNFSTAFCQNDTSNQRCIAKHILKEEVVGSRAKAFTSLQQYHLQIITIISPARDSSKQTVNRAILVTACQSFSVNDCVCYLKREQ